MNFAVKIVESYYRQGIFRLEHFTTMEKAERFAREQNGKCTIIKYVVK